MADKFDDYAATAMPRPPALPPIGLTSFYGPPLQSQVAPPTPPFRLPGAEAGPAPPPRGPRPMPGMDHADDYYERQPPRTLTNTAGAVMGEAPMDDNPELMKRMSEFQPHNDHKGQVFVDRIEDNGTAVLIDGSGDSYTTRDVPAQKGWKEGMWIQRPGGRKRRAIP